MRRPRLPLRQRLEGVPASRAPSAASRCRRAWSSRRRIDPPIFTPATKAESGHDENIPFAAMAERHRRRAGRRRSATLSLADLRRRPRAYAEARGLILADTKFEWGHDRRTGELLLIDEVLTPDSSRYWPADGYRPGGPQPSFDKQFVRDWLDASGWDKASPPPALPDEVVARTRAKYIEALRDADRPDLSPGREPSCSAT